jgi:hypothetical protein
MNVNICTDINYNNKHYCCFCLDMQLEFTSIIPLDFRSVSPCRRLSLQRYHKKLNRFPLCISTRKGGCMDKLLSRSNQFIMIRYVNNSNIYEMSNKRISR